LFAEIKTPLIDSSTKSKNQIDHINIENEDTIIHDEDVPKHYQIKQTPRFNEYMIYVNIYIGKNLLAADDDGTSDI
jgi:hypothetical protein